nr:unnamed protein product [Callosobruchus chinensis]
MNINEICKSWRQVIPTMLPVLFIVACLAFGASASSCVVPPVGLVVDRDLLSGIWFVQDLYGKPPVPANSCYSLTLSVNYKNRLDLIKRWNDNR